MRIDFSNKELYNQKYIYLIHNKKRYHFLMGWWWSWKSVFTAQKEIIKTFEKWNRLIAVRKVKDTLKDSCYSELVWIINQWWLKPFFEITKSPLYIKNTLTWSDILFRWLDDVEKLKSVKNPTRIWIEEATEISKEDFNQLDIRLRGENKELQISCTYNPVSDQHWLITDFWNYWTTDEVECLHSTYKDNKFVWQEQYNKVMERLKEQDLNMYNIYALWIPWKAIEWLIFSYEVIKEVPEEAKFKWYWLDFWYNDPTALIWCYEYNWSIILNEVFYKNNIITRDIIKFLQENNINKYDEIFWDNSRPEAIEEIYRAWFNCKPCTKWKDSIINWINTMKSYKILITWKSWNLIKEFNNYCWSKDKNKNFLDKPIDDFNHWIDASRYIINEKFKKNNTFDIAIW